jgi:hypothetical protein
VAKPGNSWPKLATDGIRLLATVTPPFQHLLAIREVAPTGFGPGYFDAYDRLYILFSIEPEKCLDGRGIYEIMRDFKKED